MRLTQAMREAAAREKDRGTALIAIGVAYVRFALMHPALFRLMFHSDRLDRSDDAFRAAGKAAVRGAQRAARRAVPGSGTPPTPPESRREPTLLRALGGGARHGDAGDRRPARAARQSARPGAARHGARRALDAGRRIPPRKRRLDQQEDSDQHCERHAVGQRASTRTQVQVLADQGAVEFLGRLIRADERKPRAFRGVIETGQFRARAAQWWSPCPKAWTA